MARGRKPKRNEVTGYYYVYPYSTPMTQFSKTAICYSNVNGGSKAFDTYEEAARWVDMELIKKGKDPVNGFYTKQ